MARIGVLGTTSWGTTLAIVCARQGHEVSLLARNKAEAEALEIARCNQRVLPETVFPKSLTVSPSPIEALSEARIIIIAVPTSTMRGNVRRVKDAIPSDAVIVSGSKGIEISTGLRMTQVIASELPHVEKDRIGALSGPNLAVEISKGSPASTSLAFNDIEQAEEVQQALNSEDFRIYTNEDVTGVEIGGALKNIMAIGSGIIDGLGLGENANAAFITRGLHEITRFGVALGARLETFYGLAGMGDIIATCHSNFSRNRRVGLGLARGMTLKEVLRSIGQTAEGIPTSQGVSNIAKKTGIYMPITFITNEVLKGNLSPAQATQRLMQSAPTLESFF